MRQLVFLNIGIWARAIRRLHPGTLSCDVSVAFGGYQYDQFLNHTSASYVFAPAISVNGVSMYSAGTAAVIGANGFGGATNVNAGTLVSRRAGADVQPRIRRRSRAAEGNSISIGFTEVCVLASVMLGLNAYSAGGYWTTMVRAAGISTRSRKAPTTLATL